MLVLVLNILSRRRHRHISSSLSAITTSRVFVSDACGGGINVDAPSPPHPPFLFSQSLHKIVPVYKCALQTATTAEAGEASLLKCACIILSEVPTRNNKLTFRRGVLLRFAGNVTRRNMKITADTRGTASPGESRSHDFNWAPRATRTRPDAAALRMNRHSLDVFK